MAGSGARTLLQRLNPLRLLPSSAAATLNNPRLKLPSYSAGTPNLEVLKFGLYIMFPIGWMYYFGTNLEDRFSVPDFWPQPGTTNRIPFERDEQRQLERQLREARLERRERRLALQREGEGEREGLAAVGVSGKKKVEEEEERRGGEKGEEGGDGVLIAKPVEGRTFGPGAIERWARGQA